MSSGALGFFLGAAPGLMYLAKNMFGFQRELVAAQDMAREDSDLLDMHFSFALKADYLLRPGNFVRPGDGPGLRRAKLHLLSVRKKFLVRHAIGALLVAVGAFLGTLLAVIVR
ncbi:hypothetical protein QFZ41_001328 [Luteibacter sp. W1I16]|uniref:hypothetical protein n=1 Tax=Luteibacter sp. W1I16 TaxID=3373922 RepID=UPI003D1D37CB